MARAHGLMRLLGAIELAQSETCERLRRAFLIHDATEAFLHDLSRGLKTLPELAGYKKIERLHMARLAAALNVPHVELGGRSAAEYEREYWAAWTRAEEAKRLYAGSLYDRVQTRTQEEHRLHLLTMEVWAAVKALDVALADVEARQAWGATSLDYIHEVPVTYDFAAPDAAYTAMLAQVPAEWLDRLDCAVS